MEMTELGHSGVRVTRLGLGLASLGNMFAPVSDVQARETIDAAWSAGIRLFDTAPVYGYGVSEVRAGRALGSHAAADYVLATKVGRLIEPNGPDVQDIWTDTPPGLGPRLDYSYAAVKRSHEDSLARLGLDQIDVLHIHDPDLDFAMASTEAVRALTELRSTGAVRAISLGVNHADVAADFLRSTGPDVIDCILLAGRYSLLDHDSATALFEMCAAYGVSVIAAGVFGGGVLADPSPGAPHGYASVPATVLDRIAALRQVCDEFEVALKAAAVQFPMRHPCVASVVVGARSAAEITEVVAQADAAIPETFWSALTARGLI